MDPVPGINEQRYIVDHRVLISILNWNNAEATIQCIKSVLNQSYPDYKILVSDNASSNGSLDTIRSAFPDLDLIANPRNIGYASAHRKAADYAVANGYQLLWILNNDTTVRSDSLSELVKAYERNPVGIYGSMTLEEDGEQVRFAGGYELKDGKVDFDSISNPLRGKRLDEIDISRVGGEVAELNGSSLLIPTEIIRKYGFMPEDFFLYSEETAYGYRLRNRGVYSFLVASSIVTHAGSQSFSNPYLKYVAVYYRMRNDLLLRKELKLISNRQIFNSLKWINWISWFVKRLLFALNIRKFSMKHYYRQLGMWHAMINKRGKTLAPENFLDSQN